MLIANNVCLLVDTSYISLNEEKLRSSHFGTNLKFTSSLIILISTSFSHSGIIMTDYKIGLVMMRLMWGSW